MVRRCWVNFQCQGVLLIWIIVGQGPIALGVGAGGGCLDIFSLICHFSFLSPSLWETARYRLKYCLKGPLSPKQPINQLVFRLSLMRGKPCIRLNDLKPSLRFPCQGLDPFIDSINLVYSIRIAVLNPFLSLPYPSLNQ